MRPETYYNQQFRRDFQIFMHSLDTLGSCSRNRGSLLRLGFDSGAIQSKEAFSIYDLAILEDKDHLRDIDEKTLFLFSVAYTIMIDQVVYAHFPKAYRKFNELTRYPKMDSTCGFAGFNINSNPFSIFNPDFERTRGLKYQDLLALFPPFAEFICADLIEFFTTYGPGIGIEGWRPVFTAMLADGDVVNSPFGKLIGKAAEKALANP